jgi:hypothetical protein
VGFGAVNGTVAEGQANWLEGDEFACPSVTDCDLDGVRAMYRACIQRAMHDACGATVVAPTQVQQMKFAKQAWHFLYSNDKENRDDRWFVCMLAGVDPEALEARMAVAAIPNPTYETLRNAWTQLELAYWRLGGQKGEKPEARPENSKPATRGDTNARVAKGHRVNAKGHRVNRHSRDRRDAGQPIVPRRSGTLLFGERRGVPARPKFAGTALFGTAASAQLKLFG